MKQKKRKGNSKKGEKNKTIRPDREAGREKEDGNESISKLCRGRDGGANNYNNNERNRKNPRSIIAIIPRNLKILL